ncbi:MAG: peptidoglycan DD-metalloendopeptidase family protein [Sulfuriferula multivorans]|uniref:Peptidoglycan DD-metalloendopeptidase family protein n=1 Tax=Sulfuriferula multivorans TaxID=1559896 RepID=A0A7C9P8I9_9PROT|nr:peptidoglycan DD-metalloendopeptidase family protein [Sulfuriferula multivorans]
MTRRYWATVKLLALLTLCWPLAVSAGQVDRKKTELDVLKQRLQTLQQDFRKNQTQRKEAADGLRQSESAISNGVRQLRQLDDARQRTQSDLQTLSQQAETTDVRIRQQQAHLAQALKGAYQRGQGDALKLILNGADPNQTARDLRYLAHLSRAQHEMIEVLRVELAKLSELQQAAAQKKNELTQLQAAREAEQQKLLVDKREREQVMNKLSAEIQKQRREISSLKRDERSLTDLVERLNRVMAQQAAREAARARAAALKAQKKPKEVQREGSASRKAVAVNTATPVAFRSDRPFSGLKGLLRLPVAGELMNRFGAPREGGGLSWKGLFIRSAQGTAVKAIAAGQVVFADWLRGFGNLVIVDHGEGYMSLYSNNESLYKQVGERVQPGDAIATVGNSGGQPDTGLYFEMRHQSRPVNPLLWVK